jgi:GT2 family glycosyltransferase
VNAEIARENGAAVPDVSIVIASWNVKEHLRQCLRSIESSPHSVAVETIVIDNASTDGSPQAVAEEFPRVTLVRNAENLGFARASNIGIAQASGRYLCLMNSDAFARQGALDTLVRFMDSRPSVGLAGPRILNPDGSLQPSCRRFPGLTKSLRRALAADRLLPASAHFSAEMMTHWSHDAERSVDAVSGCFWIARREAVRDVGPLDERFFFCAEDVDWCMRLRARGWDVRFCPEAEVVHVGGVSTSGAPLRFAVERERARLQLYRKHYGRAAAACFAALAFVHHAVRVPPRLLLYAIRPSQRTSLRIKLGEHVACLRWLARL